MTEISDYAAGGRGRVELLFDRVSDDRAIRAGRVIAIVSMVSAATSVAIFVALGEFGLWYEEWGVHNAVGGFLFGLILFVAIRRQPRNGAVWAVGWSGLFQAVTQALAAAITVWLVVDRYGSEAVADYRSTADLAPSIDFFVWLGAWSWVPALGLMLGFAFLLFPDGRLPSPRWRGVAWLAAASMTGATIGLLVSSEDVANTSELPLITQLSMPFLGLAVLASIGSVFLRYRHADGDQRHQLRWMAFVGAIFGGLFVVSFAFDLASEPSGGGLTQATTLATLPLLVGGYAVAILKYRLYDVDVVISKSVTYLGLATAITLIYSAVVVGPLLILGKSDEGGPGLVLPIVATAMVAVLFEPIRSRMRRWANRLVYGNRSTPHEVLSTVTARLAEAAAGSGPSDLARLLAEGTGAERAIVWLRSGDSLHPEGSWPDDKSEALEAVVVGDLIDDECSESRAVLHGDHLIGSISITKPTSDPVTPTDRELLSDVAGGAGLLLRNISLNRQLEERAGQLRQSRRRLIAAQDTERHRLERNLHDGAQQQVVALKVKLGIAKTIAEREGAEEIAALASALADQTQQAVDSLRGLAHGIYPPLLEAEGLEPALRAVERSVGNSLAVETRGLGRYPRDVEATAYFVVVEAAEQARMSGSSFVRANLHDQSGELVIEIEHDGRTTNDTMAMMADRIDVLGGHTVVEDSESLTRITGRLPTALEHV